MITNRKLKIFISYKGDVDAFQHGKNSDKKAMEDADFFLKWVGSRFYYN